MNITGIGDPFIPDESMEEIFRHQNRLKGDFQKISWGITDLSQLQQIRSLYEEKGPGAVPTPEHILEEAERAQILVVHFTPLSSEIISELSELRVIGVARAGVQNVDVEAANAKGILVFNVTGRNAEAVSDFTVGLMLAESRNIARSHLALLQGTWRKQFTNTPYTAVLSGKSVGLVGYGHIGRLVARKLSGFQTRILVYDPYASAETIHQDGCQTSDLTTLFRECDFISLHAKLTAENEKFINAELIAGMKRTAYLINTARAGLVDQDALIEALAEGRLGGAALDVFPAEPLLSDSPLLQLDNVTLTSHLAGVTEDTYRHSMERLYQNLADFLEHGKQDNLVNRSAAERSDLQQWLIGLRG